jgi:heme exporter protein A
MAATPDATVAVALRARDLVRVFGVARAIDSVDFDLAAQRVGAVLGPNGAGKTTLLALLAGVDRPDSGSVWVGGRDLVRRRRRARALVGYVGHQPLLYPDLTLCENLRFYAALYGAETGAGAIRARLATVGLEAHGGLLARNLSHGELRRASIARALVHDPPILVADEPYSGLDPDAARELDGTLRALAEAGRTVLFSTHDVARAQAVADTIAVLDRGRVAWSGDAGAFPGWEELTGAAASRAPGRAGTPAPLPDGRAAEQRPTSETGPVATPQWPSFGATTLAVLAKDLKIETRARQIVPLTLVYGLLLAVLVHFALPEAAGAGAAVFPGALWLSLVFGTTLAYARGAAQESVAVAGLVASPADPGALFLGKWLASAAFSALAAAVLVPASAVFLNVPPFGVAAVAATTGLGLAGWAAAGTLVAAMVAHGRSRDALVPLVLLPLGLPLVVSAMQATAAAVQGESLAQMGPLLALLVAYDVIFVVAGFLAYGLVLESGR